MRVFFVVGLCFLLVFLSVCFYVFYFKFEQPLGITFICMYSTDQRMYNWAFCVLFSFYFSPILQVLFWGHAVNNLRQKLGTPLSKQN